MSIQALFTTVNGFQFLNIETLFIEIKLKMTLSIV